jgi:CubicO group peptidase (beta-lactamase class C family)
MSSRTDAPPPQTAAESDPGRLGWMQGFPPADDRAVTFADGSFRQFPQSRWAFSHFRQLLPTKQVWRGRAHASPLPRAERSLGDVPVALHDGRRITFDDALALTYADGIAVLHRGQLVHERYFGALEPHRPHIAMSVTKSFVGLLASMLVHEGSIDPAAPVTTYVPELAGSGFADARVADVMDMTTALAYSEVYADTNSDIRKMRRAVGSAPPLPGAPPTSLLHYLTTIVRSGTHGERFTYRTPNTDVLAWIVRRVTGSGIAELVSERIWQPMGAEEDAYFTVDRLGIEFAGGGLNTTLRDLARFGETMRARGSFNGRQIVPAAVVDDIAKGADPGKFDKASYPMLQGWSYRAQWWVSHDPNGVFMARGIHGQSIWIDPRSEVVIARYGSHPMAGNVANDPITLPTFRAVCRALAG